MILAEKLRNLHISQKSKRRQTSSSATILTEKETTMTRNTALVLSAPLTQKLVISDIPPPPFRHLQIRILTTTLCGSDLHYYSSFRNGSIVPSQPMILGHEACGEVVSIGPGADKHWNIGDLVALEVGSSCGDCRLCRDGRYNLCSKMLFRSSAKYPVSLQGEGEKERRKELEGTLQQYINQKEWGCHKLPTSFPPVLASLIEPFSVALHAVKRANIPPATYNQIRILILGCGPIGLLVSLYLQSLGLSNRIFMADISAPRVNYAVTQGFTTRGITLPARNNSLPDNLPGNPAAEFIVSSSNALNFDYVFECTGSPSAVNTAIHCAGAGGRVVLLGIPPAQVAVDLGMASLREVDLVGSFRYAGEYKEAIKIVSGSDEVKEKLGRLVTHVVRGLEGAEEGFRILREGKDKEGEMVVKVCVDMRPE